ncbi:hypothetical protein LTR95_003852 [Oleoguttula sp. CCFEE 5521]
MDVTAAGQRDAKIPSRMQNMAQEVSVEEREAMEYWQYLFKPDKTATDKLKALLRGLKNVINEQYEPSDNPDLTPNQLASFYRDVGGNYDQLFLGTPGAAIGFIYKSLGCLHSLQPLSHSTAFTEPTVPALKTEGWIMFETIQTLLGPDEHSAFLMEAVRKYDVKNPVTGEVFPKILPRYCFPLEPDKHMVAWYEGVSERLRKEAEREEMQRVSEADRPGSSSSKLAVRRVDSDDEGSVDSRGPALAYFRNPLYRHVDGRPSIVRRGSKRPTSSPRPTIMERGKEAAVTIGHVVREVASPSMWIPGISSDRDRKNSSRSRSRTRDRDRRRRSVPQNYFRGASPVSDREQRTSGRPPYRRQRSSRSAHGSRLSDQMTPDDRDEEAVGTPTYTPQADPPAAAPHHRVSSHISTNSHLRHSRSHEPTPTQYEGDDYFQGAMQPDSVAESPQALSPQYIRNNIGPSFGPSASPLFASQVAKHPQPLYRRDMPPPPARDSAVGSQSGLRNSSIPNPPDRPYSASPSRSSVRFDESHRGERSHRHSRHGSRPEIDDRPYHRGSSIRDDEDIGQPLDHSRSRKSDASQSGRPGRQSGSDLDAYSGAEGRSDSSGRGPGKQARFAEPAAVKGVHGRKYVAEVPWR